MASALSSLYVEFSASTSKFVDACADVVRSAKDVDKFLKPIKIAAQDVGDALAAGVTVPILALGAAAVTAAVKIDEAMDSIRAQTGKTGEAFATLGTDFRTVLAEVPNSINDVSKAIGDLTSRTGLAGKPLQDLATQELNLARLTKTEIGETIAASTRVFADWSIATDKQSAALDFLFKTGQQTGIGFSQLSRSIQQFGVPLREMGFSFEQSAVLLAKFEKEGVNSENVMAALRKSLATLGKAGVSDAAEGFTILIDRIKTAGTVSQANAVAVAGFGAKAGPLLAAAVREGKFSIDDLLASIEKSPDTINKAAAATLSLTEKLDIFKNKAALALVPIGSTLIDAFERLIPTAQRALNEIASIADAFSKLPASTQNAIIGFGLFAAAAGPALLVITNISSSLVRLITLIAATGVSLTGLSEAVAGVSILTAARTVEQLSAGITLLGATSVAATGGLIAIAGAIGFGIGAAANYIIKLVGLQGALDDIIKRTAEIVPVFGKWLTAQADVNAANQNVVGSTQVLTAELAKHGITVDQTRLNEVGYIASLAQQRAAQIDATETSSKHTAAVGAAGKAASGAGKDLKILNDLLSGNGSAAKEAQKRIDELVDSVTEETKKGPELTAALTILQSKHVDLELIVARLGKQTVAYADALARQGLALPPVVAGIAAATVKTEELNDANARAFEIAVRIGEITEKNDAQLKQYTIDNAYGRAQMTIADDKYLSGLNAAIAAQTQFEQASYRDEISAKIKATNDLIANDTTYREKIRDLTAATNEYKILADQAYSDAFQTTTDINTAVAEGADANIIQSLRDRLAQQLAAFKAYGEEYRKTDEETAKASLDNWKKFYTSQEQARENMELSMSKAMSSISTDIASELSKDIVHWSGWKDSIIKIGQDAATKMLNAFLTGLLNPLTNALSSIGKSISGALSNIVFGGGGGAGGGILGGIFGGGAGAAGGAATGGGAAAGAGGGAAASGGLGTTIASLATNPITIAAAAALGAGLLIKHYVGQGRRTADEFVQGTQNPFGQNLSAIVDAFDASQKAGTLTAESIDTARNALTQLWSAFQASAADFAAQGATQQKVVNQAYSTLNTDFGANLSNLFAKFDAATAALSTNNGATNSTTGASTAATSTTIDATTQSLFTTAIKSFGDWVAKLTGSQIPVTGVATSASQILANSATQLAAAVNAFVPRLTTLGTAPVNNVTLNSNVVSNVTIDGTKLTALEIRDTIETQIVDDVKNDIHGMRAGLLDALGLA